MQGLETENENLKNQVKNLMEQLNSRINFDQLQFGGWNKLDFGSLNRLDFAKFFETLNAFNEILKFHNPATKTTETSSPSTSSNIFSKLNGIVYSSLNTPLLNKQYNSHFEFEINLSRTSLVSANSQQQLVNATNEMKKLGEMQKRKKVYDDEVSRIIFNLLKSILSDSFSQSKETIKKKIITITKICGNF